MHARLSHILGQRACFWVLLGVIVIATLYWSNAGRRHLPLLGTCCVLVQGRMYHPRIPTATIFEADGRTQVFEYSSDEAQRLRDRVANGTAAEVASAMCFPMKDTRGLLAPVFERRDHTVSISPAGAPLTGEKTAKMRAAYVALLTNDPRWSKACGPEYLRLLAQGDGKTTIIHWGWAAHDALALVVLGLLGWSWDLSYGYLARERQRLDKRRRVLASGLCPICRYSLDGLGTRPSQCPECGEMLEHDSSTEE